MFFSGLLTLFFVTVMSISFVPSSVNGWSVGGISSDDLEHSNLGKAVGSVSKGVTGYDSVNKAREDYQDDGRLQGAEQNSWIGKGGGEATKQVCGGTSINDCTEFTAFDAEIPFYVPYTTIPGTIELSGNLANIQDSRSGITILGFKPAYSKLGSDFILSQRFEGTLEDIARDLYRINNAGPSDIDRVKNWIKDNLGIDVQSLGRLVLDLDIELPVPTTVTEVTQISSLVPQITAAVTGCYNRISNNLPDIESNGLESFLNEDQNTSYDPNTFINQEEECVKLI